VTTSSIIEGVWKVLCAALQYNVTNQNILQLWRRTTKP
jgi:hypothetical protein